MGIQNNKLIMRSLSEIETAVKRASRAVGFSWGISEDVGKSIRSVSYTHLTLPTILLV